MRNCHRCNKEDSPWFGEEPCSCGAAVLHEKNPSPLRHTPECNGIQHEVVAYPVRMAVADLTWDKKLPERWTAKGWQLMVNGLRYYRVRLLCRDCIAIENSIQAREREYKDLCRKAQGLDTQTYAQFLAAQ